MITRYLDFRRSAGRSEFWGVMIIGWVLAMIWSVVTIAVMILDGVFVFLGGLIMLAGFLALIWLMLATTASRCRDAGINPWWTAATFLPYIGLIVLIVVGCLSTRSPQQS